MLKNRYLRSYSELVTISGYAERINYLSLTDYTYVPPSREISERFYKSSKWLYIRDKVIKRDLGSDLGLLGFDIEGVIIVHHINPITEEDILSDSVILYDMNNLITVSLKTHNKIHYGIKDTIHTIQRTEGDTTLWKRKF